MNLQLFITLPNSAEHFSMSISARNSFGSLSQLSSASFLAIKKALVYTTCLASKRKTYTVSD